MAIWPATSLQEEVAQHVSRTVRKLLAHYGGEEFALVLVESDHEAALEVAERVRRTIEAEPFHFEGDVFPLTISLGVAATRSKEELTVAALFQRADQCLYQAKAAGRNCVFG